MSGNPCGTYGLMKEGSDGDIEVLCSAGTVLNGRLQRGNVPKLKLWYTNHTTSEPECFFWCTKDGTLPVEFDDRDEILGDTLAQLVSLLSTLVRLFNFVLTLVFRLMELMTLKKMFYQATLGIALKSLHHTKFIPLL